MAKYIQKVYTVTLAINALARFDIVKHCYATSFPRKTILCETNNIFKINMRSRWTVFQILQLLALSVFICI